MKKLSLLFGASILAGSILVGCGESTVEPVEAEEEVAAAEDVEAVEEENTEDVEEETVEEEEVVEESISVGSTVNFDGLHITLNDVYTSEGNDFETPENDHYLVLDLTIENTTDESAHISTLMQMSIQDDEGYTHDVAFFTDVKGSLDGEIGPGRNNRGEVPFDVNASDTYEFIFENPWTSGQAIWEVSLD